MYYDFNSGPPVTEIYLKYRLTMGVKASIEATAKDFRLDVSIVRKVLGFKGV
jgi:hypothetical protein